MKTQLALSMLCIVYTTLVEESMLALAMNGSDVTPTMNSIIYQIMQDPSEGSAMDPSNNVTGSKNNVFDNSTQSIEDVMSGNGSSITTPEYNIFNDSKQGNEDNEMNNSAEKDKIDGTNEDNTLMLYTNGAGTSVFFFFMAIISLVILTYVVYEKRKRIKSYVKRSKAKVSASRRRHGKGYKYEKISSEDRAAVNSYIF